MRLPHSTTLCVLALAAPLASYGQAPAGGTAGAAVDATSVVTVPAAHGYTIVQRIAPGIVRVRHTLTATPTGNASLMLDPQRPAAAPPSMQTREAPGAITMVTDRLQVRIDRTTGAVSFLNRQGDVVLAEQPDGSALTPATVQGESTHHISQHWQANADESLYGLGQQQLGLLDLKGYDLDLWHHNGTIAIPFLVSSRGYGVLWDNNSFTRFGDLREPVPPPPAQLLDADGHPGGLTGTYFAGANFDRLVATRVDAKIDLERAPVANAGAEDSAEAEIRMNTRIHPALDVTGPISVRWTGYLKPAVTGDHTLHLFSNCGLKVWVDGRLVINHWRQGWLEWKDVTRVHLEAGHRYPLRIEWVRNQTTPVLQLRWKTPPPGDDTALWSEVGEAVDYYFVYGPRLDGVLAGYRTLTGAAAMLPKWAFGLWQSRQRYETSQQSIDVVQGYRKRGIPLDVIVQDWQYWPRTAWGSHAFDPTRFPHPQEWIDTLHELNTRLLISVWPKFYPGTANFEAMQQAGFLYQPNLDEGIRDWLDQPYTFYDAFNPAARRLFWQQVDRDLFSKHVDAWWLDASEPDIMPVPRLEPTITHMMPTAAGTAARALNAYPLLHATGVYTGQRAAAPDQRVAILTRAGFAGLQRVGAAVWSGDSSSTWTALAKQIPAGLGSSLSGLPYWTMDVGGFSVPPRFATPHPKPEDVEEWRELNARWFEFGTFTPLLRVHGEFPHREMWEFGGEDSPAYQAELKFDHLRYRLLPYVYSVAGAVTQEGSTFMRPLVMDFPDDLQAREIGDEYLFGPALLVSPVTEYRARQRSVYLPATRGGWYDFWTGKNLAGGRTIEAAAPYDAIPLHVRAGAILPFGPELQYAMEHPADPLTLYVYAGADGAFALYEDDGLSYGYERGEFSRIPLRWDDAAQTLTIGARAGSFPGLLQERTLAVVVVTPQQPQSYLSTPVAPRSVHYTGEAVTISFQP